MEPRESEVETSLALLNSNEVEKQIASIKEKIAHVSSQLERNQQKLSFKSEYLRSSSSNLKKLVRAVKELEGRRIKLYSSASNASEDVANAQKSLDSLEKDLEDSYWKFQIATDAAWKSVWATKCSVRETQVKIARTTLQYARDVHQKVLRDLQLLEEDIKSDVENEKKCRLKMEQEKQEWRILEAEIQKEQAVLQSLQRELKTLPKGVTNDNLLEHHFWI